MRNVQNKRGRLAKILLRLFIVCLVVSLTSIIVLITNSDVTDTPEYKATHSGSDTKDNKSSHSSEINSGTANRNYYLETKTNLEGAGTYTRYTNSSIAAGESVTLRATANEGYTFVGWYNETTRVTTNTSFTFTMPEKNVTYTARFEEKNNYYTLTTTTNLAGAGVFTSFANSKMTVGAVITLKATEKAGYNFLGWYDGTTKLTDNRSYSFTMPARNVTYTAKFEKSTPIS